MRQMIRRKKATGRRDPAPSRLAYRVERMRLTPGFRRLVRIGLPLAVLSGIVLFCLNDHTTRTRIELAIADFRQAIEERPEFMVQMMAVDGASDELAEDIREILPVDFPISSFDLDLEAMLDAVQALDPVQRAEVRIRAGGILQIDVAERMPVLVWRGPQGVELLDAEGRRVGGLIARAARPDLPLITGEGAEIAAAEAIELLDAAQPIAPRIRGLVRRGTRRWDVMLDRGQRIELPEQGAISALERVIALDQAQDLLARDVVAVDMRNGTRPTVRMAGQAVTELLRIRGLNQGDPSE